MLNCFGVVVFHRSIVNWRRGWGQSAMGLCAFCYIWQLFDVVVFQRSMLNWSRGVGSICHGYMCIVLYMKLMWCNGFAEMYAWLEWGYIWLRYMQIVLYVKLLWCSGIAYIYCHLEERVGSICQGYMCILLYMKVIWFSCFPEIYAQFWRRGWDQSAMGICAFCYTWKLFDVVIFPKSMLNWRRGGINVPWLYVHSAIYKTYVVEWFFRDLCSIGGRGGSSAKYELTSKFTLASQRSFLRKTDEGFIHSKNCRNIFFQLCHKPRGFLFSFLIAG